MVPIFIPRIMSGLSVVMMLVLLVARFQHLDAITRQFWILPVALGLAVASRIMRGRRRL